MNRTRQNNRFSRTRTGGGYADGSGGGDRDSRFGSSAASPPGEHHPRNSTVVSCRPQHPARTVPLHSL
ncbi:hypothetical protein ACFWWB_05095 [Streptomyces sp. NPDC058690]|uniref:hypothetical protein n=1 Tax=Streptomyces sp. NPDC058690 TaxID=3346600 RepID=UPI00366087BB